MILYHRTTRENTEAIEKEGFKDAIGTYFTDQEFTGVWVSDVPLDCNDGAWGDVLFQITLVLPETAIADYEWVEEGKPYREWLITRCIAQCTREFEENLPRFGRMWSMAPGRARKSEGLNRRKRAGDGQERKQSPRRFS